MIGAFHQPRGGGRPAGAGRAAARIRAGNSGGDQDGLHPRPALPRHWIEANAELSRARRRGAGARGYGASCEIKAADRGPGRARDRVRGRCSISATPSATRSSPATGYGELLHGEAVAAGMAMAARLGAAGARGARRRRAPGRAVRAVGLPVRPPRHRAAPVARVHGSRQEERRRKHHAACCSSASGMVPWSPRAPRCRSSRRSSTQLLDGYPPGAAFSRRFRKTSPVSAPPACPRRSRAAPMPLRYACIAPRRHPHRPAPCRAASTQPITRSCATAARKCSTARAASPALQVMRSESEAQQRAPCPMRAAPRTPGRDPCPSRYHAPVPWCDRRAAYFHRGYVPMMRIHHHGNGRPSARCLPPPGVPGQGTRSHDRAAGGRHLDGSACQPSPNNSLLAHIFEPLVGATRTRSSCRAGPPPPGRRSTTSPEVNCTTSHLADGSPFTAEDVVFHAAARAEGAQQPLVIRDVHQADRRRGLRRSVHDHLQDRDAARAACRQFRRSTSFLEACTARAPPRRTTTPARRRSAPDPTSSSSTSRTSAWSWPPTTDTGAARPWDKVTFKILSNRPRASPRCSPATCR